MNDNKALSLYFDRLHIMDDLPDAKKGRLIWAIIQYAETGILPDFGRDLTLKIAFKCLKVDVDRAQTRETKDAKKAGAPKGNKNAAKAESGDEVEQDVAELGESENFVENNSNQSENNSKQSKTIENNSKQLNSIQNNSNQLENNSKQLNSIQNNQNNQNNSFKRKEIKEKEIKEKELLEKESVKEKEMSGKPDTRTRFKAPSVDEVRAYVAESGYSLDAERFVDYYSSNGWKVGRNPMKDWKAAVRNWCKGENSSSKPVQAKRDPDVIELTESQRAEMKRLMAEWEVEERGCAF